MKRRLPKIAIPLPFVLAVLCVGCNERPEVQADGEQPAAQVLPFEQTASQKGKSPTLALDTIPAGTAIRVRLQAPLSSNTSRSGDVFTGVLDQSIVLDGRLVLERGASITGRVLEARASGTASEPGYLRLTLTQIILNGKSMPLETSSLFAKGAERGKASQASLMTTAVHGANSVAPAPSSDVKLPPQQPLTFRLASSLSMPG